MKNQTKSGKDPEKKEHVSSSNKKTAPIEANKKHPAPGVKDEQAIKPNTRGQNNLIMENTMPSNNTEERITNEDHKIVNEDGDYDFFDPTTLIMYLGNIRKGKIKDA